MPPWLHAGPHAPWLVSPQAHYGFPESTLPRLHPHPPQIKIKMWEHNIRNKLS